MVRAILDNRKSKTRRTKGLESINSDPDKWYFQSLVLQEYGKYTFALSNITNPADFQMVEVSCPYGKPGDILWVRETYSQTETGYIYKSDLTSDEIHKFHHSGNKWKPSRFMPKKAARIWLEIEDVTVERLQDISDKDAKSEGIKLLLPSHLFKNYNERTEPKEGFSRPTSSFESLWRFINGNYSWESNPWVWVIKFKVLSTTGKPENLNDQSTIVYGRCKDDKPLSDDTIQKLKEGMKKAKDDKTFKSCQSPLPETCVNPSKCNELGFCLRCD